MPILPAGFTPHTVTLTPRNSSVTTNSKTQPLNSPCQEKKPDDSGCATKLDPRQEQLVEELAKCDREVRAHEAAHRAAGGGLTGPASFTYEIGPDGKRYAVAGEVSIDAAAVPNDPQATLRRANQIRAAAMAPAHPSSQDQAVAAQAAQMAAQARAELLTAQHDDAKKDKGKETTAPARSEHPPAETANANDQRLDAYSTTQAMATLEPGTRLNQTA
jgi:hypothetical protein